MTVKCQICNSEYKFCPDCDKINSYKKVVDNPTCYKIYMILYEFRENIIDKDKAKTEFATIRVTEKTLRNFKLIDAVHNRIAEIIREDIIESEEIENSKAFKKSAKYK